MNQTVLYPSNWLYNAGVIGLLRSAEEIEKIDVTSMLNGDGSVHIPVPFFQKLDLNSRYFSENKISSIVGKSSLYRNFLQPNQKEIFTEFVRALDNLSSGECDICGNGRYLDMNDINYLNSKDPAKKNETKFLYRIQRFSIIHYSDLGPSLDKFPNAFWSLRQSARVCHLCSFLIIHHHLAFVHLSDGSEIFINAPSFQVMWYLNKFVREVFGSTSSEETHIKRNILAMSVIEYATKIQATLGVWTGMNIEVVNRRTFFNPTTGERETRIEFFSLPYKVIQLLSDQRIASILSQIGEFSILNCVLDQNFSRLIEIGYKLLRIGLKPPRERTESENDFITRILYLDRNRRDPLSVAEQIFSIYSLIEEKQRRRRAYEQVSFARI